MAALKHIFSFSKNLPNEMLSDKGWHAYWENVKEKACFRRCRPEQIKLDGKYTKLLKAYAKLLGLKHEVYWSKTICGLGLEIQLLFIKNDQHCSTLGVYEEDIQVASMYQYTQNANEDTVEEFSKKILESTFGSKRYIKSFIIYNDIALVGNLQKSKFMSDFELHDIPQNENQLLLKLACSGIDVDSQVVSLKEEKKIKTAVQPQSAFL